MCGIAGVASATPGGVDRDALESMIAALMHRGPDSGGLVIDGPGGIGARRLAIIDLPGGDQPISNEDGSIHVVQNGEIYNYRELRRELLAAGHRLTTHGDTEVLVHLYEDRGERFVEALRGMFAIAIWDARRRRLVLARDRYGIKPLFYREAGGELAFGSELKALLHRPGFSTEIDLNALEAYLAFNAIPSPMTIFRDVRKLPAGHILVWEVGRGTAPRIERYADVRPVAAADVRRESEADLAAELLERLEDSVRAHLVSDVPVGVFLSGGIDSSTLTALASRVGTGRVQTFSIGFEERSFSELDLARLVARRYDTDHHEMVVRPDAMNLFPKLVEAFDEPFADNSALPTYLVSQLARRHVKVALSGEGGDELFGGYYTYVADLLAPRVGPIASALRPLVERLPSSSGKNSIEFKARRFARAAHLPPLERHSGWKEIFTADARAELLDPRRRGTLDPVEIQRRHWDATEGSTPLARFQHVDLAVYLADTLLVKIDRASMAHSLEGRVPFLDPVVASFAFSLPDQLKVRGFSKKRLLRKAVAPLLPRELLAARKQGFSVPAAAWLRGEMLPFAREVLAPSEVRRQGFFRPEEVTRLLDRHAARREDHSHALWALLFFAFWHDRYVGSVDPVRGLAAAS